LPTTATNGITGSWSPAINNQATTTYTFTPNTGQCAVSTTLTITVNPSVTPTFAVVAAICAGTVLNPLPLTSTNGITGTWSPALNNLATTTYTFTPTTGQCATTTTLTIVVNPANTLPTFGAIAPICAGAAGNPLPATSANNITGTWSPAFDNTATTTYTFTPNAGQCAIPTTLTVVVNVGTTPTFTQVAPICSGDALAALPTTSNNGITGNWSPALNNTQTTTYTFTPIQACVR
jgi:serine protease inhibitor